MNINQDCTTNSRLMGYYFLPRRIGYKKILLLAGPSLRRDVENIPIAETKEINEKGFQIVASGALNFKTIHYYFKELSLLRDIPGDFYFLALCCFKRFLSFYTPAMSLFLLIFCLKLTFTMSGGIGLQYYTALV